MSVNPRRSASKITLPGAALRRRSAAIGIGPRGLYIQSIFARPHLSCPAPTGLQYTTVQATVDSRANRLVRRAHPPAGKRLPPPRAHHAGNELSLNIAAPRNVYTTHSVTTARGSQGPFATLHHDDLASPARQQDSVATTPARAFHQSPRRR